MPEQYFASASVSAAPKKQKGALPLLRYRTLTAPATQQLAGIAAPRNDNHGEGGNSGAFRSSSVDSRATITTVKIGIVADATTTTVKVGPWRASQGDVHGLDDLALSSSSFTL
jgi:hypothetical protein